MPLILPGNVASATASTVYNIDNSCQFDGTNDYMVRSATGSSTESNNKWTFSCWVKRCKLGAEQMILDHRGSGNQFNIRFNGDDSLQAYDYVGGNLMQRDTSAKYRDPSAWYHILWSSDRSIGSPTTKLWVNGTEVTSWATSTEYSQDDTAAANQNYDTWIGGENSSGSRLGAYIAELVWLDGTFVSNATDFGEYDSDSPTIWKPKDVSGLTFGTNGYYFDFKASDNLGNDANGGTDFTETGLAAVNQATDTPTNSFSTLNPIVRLGAHSTLSEGNCHWTLSSAGYESVFSTFLVNAGKWYVEFKFIGGTHQYTGIIAEHLLTGLYESVISGDSNVMYNHAGNKQIGNSSDGAAQSSYGSTYTSGDIVGMALDYDNNYMYFAKNNTWQNSGDPESGATGTGGLALPSTTHAYAFGMSKYASGTTGLAGANFGGCPPFALSSAESDANGYGNFEYAPPAGFLALCTKNLGSDGG